jgi:hypothetical protein
LVTLARDAVGDLDPPASIDLLLNPRDTSEQILKEERTIQITHGDPN